MFCPATLLQQPYVHLFVVVLKLGKAYSSFNFRFRQVNNAIYFLGQKIYITGLEKKLKFQLVLWASRSYICLSRVTNESCSS